MRAVLDVLRDNDKYAEARAKVDNRKRVMAMYGGNVLPGQRSPLQHLIARDGDANVQRRVAIWLG